MVYHAIISDPTLDRSVILVVVIKVDSQQEVLQVGLVSSIYKLCYH